MASVKVTCKDVETRKAIVAEVERMMTNGKAIWGCSFTMPDGVDVEVRGMYGLVDDLVRPFILDGRAKPVSRRR